MMNVPPNQVRFPLPESTSDPLLVLVRKACSLPGNRFGPEILEEHLLIVERFALQLAEVFGADREVVKAAALLHDIAAIYDFTCLPRHAEAGGEMIASLLSSIGPAGRLGFDDARIDQVAICVREHSSPKKPAETTLESVCTSHADAMSQIVRPLYWFCYARTLKELTHGEALEWYRALIRRNWNSLLDEAKSLVESEYRAVAIITDHK